jgi:hypothetical protein
MHSRRYYEDDDDSYEDEDIGDGLGEYFSSRNEDGELTHLFDPPPPGAWQGLFLPEPYQPPAEEEEEVGDGDGGGGGSDDDAMESDDDSI